MRKIIQLCFAALCVAGMSRGELAGHELSATIQTVERASNGVNITFTVSGEPAFIDLEGSETLTGIYRTEQNVEIAPVSDGVMKALIPASTQDRFFRVRLLPAGVTNTLSVPVEARNEFGNSWKAMSTSTPLQQIYASAEFSDAAGDLVEIHGVSLRLNEPMALLDNRVVKRLTITVGVYQGRMEDLPASGYVPYEFRETTLDRENMTLTRIPGEPPQDAFDVPIWFDKPYRYDPSLGHLVMYVGEMTFLTGGFNVDCHNYTARSGGRLYSSDFPNAARGVNAMIVTKFLYTTSQR